MKAPAAGWDFHYEPSRRPPGQAGAGALDVIVATRSDVGAAALRGALRALGPDLAIEPLISRPPLHWTRVRAPRGAAPADVAALLSGLPLRYVADARAEAMQPAPPLAFSPDQRVDAAAGSTPWAARRRRPVPPAPSSGGRWFLGGGGGVRVDRGVCGTGAGTRLAVIDDEAADVEHLEIDALVCVGVDRAPATTGHAALMVAWATGAAPAGSPRFFGVAPDASVRLYCIPKAGIDVVSLPLAIARAVFDGADVVVCATYVEGTVGPLLDDALDVAAHLGRRGRGTAVVLPTGREAASPGDSIHASLSLGLGDPASDPRVHCVAPGGRGGGWFIWRSPRGKLRPFANRGPAVRWTAPGDDVAHPFSPRDRLFHAESSGASAIAAGVVLLVLGCNPRLRLHDLHALLATTARAPRPDEAVAGLVDSADILPPAYDRDGHNAKTGYGRLDAARACAAARDPIALELVAMGEDATAESWAASERPYSAALGRWTVRALLRRPDLGHALRAALRHARLISAQPSRAEAHAPGALARQLVVVVRELLRMRPPRSAADELSRVLTTLSTLASAGDPTHASLEGAATALFQRAERGGASPLPEAVSTASIRA